MYLGLPSGNKVAAELFLVQNQNWQPLIEETFWFRAKQFLFSKN
jgi:hypothetical protein